MQTTEELKRAMYEELERLRACVRKDRVPYVSFPSFEGRLEKYLENLHHRIRILEEANRAGGDALREIVSERDSLLEANGLRESVQNAQEVPAAKPQDHSKITIVLIKLWRKLK